MNSPITIHQTVGDRSVAFNMTYTPGFAADENTRFHLQRDNACEPEVTHLMFRVLREGDFAIDAGANIGFFSLLMAKLVGPTGRVMAYEPGVNNLRKAIDNSVLNPDCNIVVAPRALWSEKVSIPFYLANDSGLNACVPSDETISESTVQTVTLDDEYNNMRLPKLIKIDVEGAELQVLKGAERMLRDRVQYITCEINEPALARFGTSQKELRSFMEYHNYGTFLLDREGGYPRRLDRKTRIVAENLNTNVLFSSMEDVAEAWPEVHL